MKTILVSGCLGTVAIFTIKELLNKGYTVIGFDNLSCNPKERINELPSQSENFVFYNSSQTDIKNCFEENKIDAILHLASRTVASESYKYPELYCDSNITLTAKLLRMAVKYNVKRFVFESSSSVYGDNPNISINTETDICNPTSIYGITKLTSEMLINSFHKQYGLETINLRCYNIFAPINYYNVNSLIPLLTNKILNDEEITLHNNGKPQRQFVHVDNIVQANILALETKNINCFGQAYNISVEDNPISLLDLVNILYDNLEIKKKIKLSDYISPGDILINYGCIDKAKSELNYIPKYNLLDGIKNYIIWVKNNK